MPDVRIDEKQPVDKTKHVANKPGLKRVQGQTYGLCKLRHCGKQEPSLCCGSFVMLAWLAHAQQFDCHFRGEASVCRMAFSGSCTMGKLCGSRLTSAGRSTPRSRTCSRGALTSHGMQELSRTLCRAYVLPQVHQLSQPLQSRLVYMSGNCFNPDACSCLPNQYVCLDTRPRRHMDVRHCERCIGVHTSSVHYSIPNMSESSL